MNEDCCRVRFEKGACFNEDYRPAHYEAIEDMTPPRLISKGTTPPASFPSFMQELESEIPSAHVLQSPHALPPLRMSAKTGSATVSASMPSPTGSDSNGNEGSLQISRSFQGGEFNVRANASGSFNGSFYVEPNTATKLGGMIDTNGMALVGCETKTSLYGSGARLGSLHVGSRCEFQSPSKFETLTDSRATNITGQAAVSSRDWIMAVEATAPVATLEPDFSYHFSADIGEAGGHPLIMSMYRSPAKASVSVTHLNKNRKLAWSLEMEKKANKSTSDAKAGLLLRLDEHVRLKAVATPSKLDGALILTSADAQAKCSLLFGIDRKKASVAGISLELDS